LASCCSALRFAQADGQSCINPAGNLPLLLCWPLLVCFTLVALGIEKLAVRLLDREQREVAAARKREVSYSEMKRDAARMASRTGGPGKGTGRRGSPANTHADYLTVLDA
jgi:hypothetical protein